MVVLAVVYLLLAILWSRVYYAKRHGVGWGVDLGAMFIAIVWPVTVFTHWNTSLCSHHDHVLERGEARKDWQSEKDQVRRILAEERDAT